MTLIEFIGFVISLAAMIFLVVKHFWEQGQRRRYPEKYAEEQKKKEKFLSEFMKSLNLSESENDDKDEDNEDNEDNEEEEVMLAEEVKYRPKLTKQIPPKPPLPPKRKGSMSDSYREEIVSSTFLKGEAAAYDLNKKRRPSRASTVLRGLPTPKNMVIIKEIFGSPKSMQINPWDDGG